MTGQRLDGWKAIAAHLNLSVRQCQRLAKSAGLPVHHRGGTQALYAEMEDLEHWIRNGGRGDEPEDIGDPRVARPARVATVNPEGESGLEGRVAGNPVRPRSSPRHPSRLRLVAAVVVGVLIGGAGWTGVEWWRHWSLRPDVVSGSWRRVVGGWSGDGSGGLLDTGAVVGPGARISVALRPRVSHWAGGLEIAQDRFHRTLIAYSPSGRKLHVLRLPSGVLTVLPLKADHRSGDVVHVQVAIAADRIELGLDGDVRDLRLEAHDVGLGRLLLAVGRSGTEFLPNLPGSCSFQNLRVTGDSEPDGESWRAPLIPPDERARSDYRVTLDNTDDQVDLLLDGRRVVTSTYGEPVNGFDLGPFLRPGQHLLTVRVFNRRWTTTYGVRLTAGGRTAWEERCGQVNVAGAECSQLGSRTGLVRTLEFQLAAQ